MSLNKDKKNLKVPKSVKELAFGMFAYSSSSIFGPMIFLGLVGFFLDKYFQTKPICLIIGVILAFIITNLLIFKKINNLVKDFNKLDQKKDEK